MSRITLGLATLAMIAGVGLNGVSAQERLNQQRQLQDRAVNSDQRSQKPTTVKELIVKKLKHSNEAEIELAQMAKDKVEHEEMKEFVDTLIQDHQDLNQKMKDKWDDGEGQRPRGAADNQPRTQVQPQPGQTQPGQQQPGQRQPTTLGQRNAPGQAAQMNQTVPSELCDIMDQAGENMLKMSKEMLQKYDGQDFQMAFLGQQISAHMIKLAELKAIESVTDYEELKPMVQESIKVVEQHLEKAKQLAKKLDSKTGSSQQAQTGQKPRR